MTNRIAVETLSLSEIYELFQESIDKPNNEQPTHKTAHLQAPTHKPMLQLAKELLSCRRTRAFLLLLDLFEN